MTRVLLRARAIRLATALTFTLALLSACASPPRSQPHRGIERVWSDFEALADERAMAIAGNPDERWVAGLAGGHASVLAAEQYAIAACRRQRDARRMQDACMLYAVGDEIIWEGHPR